MIKYVAVVLVLILLVPSPSYAYIDPASGSMLFQIIAGMFAAMVVGIKLFWYRIKSFLGFGKKVNPEEGKVADTDDLPK